MTALASPEPQADLHTHTCFSDGTCSPAELVDEAKRVGLAAVAITDHDAVDGVEPGQVRGQEIGVEVVPGVELSSHEDGGDIHIVGLFIDPRSPALLDCLLRQRQGREERVGRIVGKLRRLGVCLSEEDVLDVAGPAPPGRVHVAEALRRSGAVGSRNAAFRRYIGDNGPAYAANEMLTAEHAIQVVRQAGGISVFAHPGLTQRDHRIAELAAAGLAGLEVFCRHHSPAVLARYLPMAQQYGLLPAGGSDFHGDHSEHALLGSVTVPMSSVEDLRAAAGRMRTSA